MRLRTGRCTLQIICANGLQDYGVTPTRPFCCRGPVSPPKDLSAPSRVVTLQAGASDVLSSLPVHSSIRLSLLRIAGTLNPPLTQRFTHAIKRNLPALRAVHWP